MKCPICKKPVALPDSTEKSDKSFFPFCSERCKLIDLGRWLDEKYQVPVKPPNSLEAESEALD